MKYLPALFCAALLTTLPVQAQEPTVGMRTDLPMPDGPAVQVAAPDLALWTVEYTYLGDKREDPNASAAAERHAAISANLQDMAEKDPHLAKLLAAQPQIARSALLPRVKKIITTKTREVRRDQLDYEQGQTGERWCTATVITSKQPGDEKLQAAAASPEVDFPGFAWVDKGAFIGIRTLPGGKQLLVFKKEMFPEEVGDFRAFPEEGYGIVSEERIEVTAFVDLQTRLPIQLETGTEIRKYTWGAAPTGMQSVPEPFLSAGRALAARQQAQSRPLSKP